MATSELVEWVKLVWEPLVKTLPPGEKLLLLDNLDAHVDMPFRAALRAHNTLAWYLPPGCTDFLQPVDAGAGRLSACACASQRMHACRGSHAARAHPRRKNRTS